MTSTRYWSAVGILAITAALGHRATSAPPFRLHQPLPDFPAQVGAWTSLRNMELSPEDLNTLRPTEYVFRQYERRGDPPLSMLAAFFARQKPGEAMHSPKNCLPGSWEFERTDTIAVPVAGAPPARVNLLQIAQNDTRRVVLYWYQTRDRVVASEYQLKLFLLGDAVIRHNSSGMIVRIDRADGPEALDRARAFASVLIPEIRKIL